MEHYRQGDVLIIKTNMTEIPKGAVIQDKLEKDQHDVILAYGESTGHSHRIAGNTADLYQWQGDRLVEIKQPTKLSHEEHDSIALDPGVYKVVRQREWDSEQQTRWVAD